jgi:hypothetical protein
VGDGRSGLLPRPKVRLFACLSREITMNKKSLPIWQTAGVGLIAGTISVLFWYYLFGPADKTYLFRWDEMDQLGRSIYQAIFLLGGLFGIIGAFAGRFWKKTPPAIWIGALVFPLSIVILIGLVLNNVCFGWC